MLTSELYPFAAFLLALGIAYFMVPSLIRFGQKQEWYDEPDARKHHVGKISSLGGIAILAGWSISVLLFTDWSSSVLLWLILAASVFLGIIGFIDDLHGVRASKKLLFQLGAGTFIFLSGISVGAMINHFTGWQITGYLDWGLTLLFIATLINAFNFMDGIDGLAGMLSVVNMLVFGVLFYTNSDFVFAVLAFGLAGSIIGFLQFNFRNARIFMGDCGSMFIGLMTAIMCMQFFQITLTSLWASPVLSLACCLLPVFDLIRVAIGRISIKKSPFTADRTHVHHLLLRIGRSTVSCCMLLLGLHLTFFMLVYQFNIWGLVICGIVNTVFVFAIWIEKYFISIARINLSIKDRPFPHLFQDDQ